MSGITLDSRVVAVEQELKGAVQKATALDAVVAERRSRSVALQSNVAQANYRLGLRPQVESYMLTLQHRVHQRSVGLYEQLLTALIQDVLPENPYPISLELDTEKGLPALSIQLGKGDSAQDIYEDTGGSLTNVVSSGLRFVALARSGLRKFLVLDEPDCWIEPFRVPRFADILSDMSNRIHVQAILISHHNDSAFANIPDRMRLEKNVSGLIEVRKSRNAVWLDDKVSGIRWIRLERFMSHLDTTLELGPGINVLSGANHIGKSAIVNALRVFCYQQGADRNIMHGHDNFVISMGIENGQVLTCTRRRTGGRKTTYSYTNPTMAAPRVEPADKGKVPDFVVNSLNIQKLNDLDIQLSHQKMPVFLLNEPKTKQASLLSAGLESDHVRTMLKQYKSWLDLDRATVLNDEKELLKIKKALDTWDSTFSGVSLSETGFNLETRRSVLMESFSSYLQMKHLLQRIEYSDTLQAVLPDVKHVDAPLLPAIQPMQDLLTLWKFADGKSQFKVTKDAPTTPVCKDLAAIADVLRLWKGADKRASMLQSIENLKMPNAPTLDLREVMDTFKQWKNHDMQNITNSAKLKTAAEQHAESVNIVNNLIQDAGNTCPVCQQTWPHEHTEHVKDTL